MNCDTIAKELSPYLDDALESGRAAQVSEHLHVCPECRRQYERLGALRQALRSLGNVTPPDYLRHLLQGRLANEKQNTWKVYLRESLEYRWSKIRTTEGIWYLTRLAGTATTFVLFIAIAVSSLSPLYSDWRTTANDRPVGSQEMRQQFRMNLMRSLGMVPLDAQRKPINPSDPMINPLYLVNFGQEASRSGSNDDTLSVVAMVDRSGSAKIQNVLEYPVDSALLNHFNSMISSARCRPASQDGRAVDSRMVLTFSKISVYD